VSVCENIFPPSASPLERIARRLLWPRLDGLIAVAGPSIGGVRAAGMPESVPAVSLVAGGLEPPTHVEPRALPFSESDFVVGFAGRIVEEKGWRILVQALGVLPPEFKLAVAGEGPDLGELEATLPGRVDVAGLLPKEELWGFYASVDCLVLPSLTRPGWKEQLGGTLLDGLVMGVPVVASASGGLPDGMGEAGLLVPEGDPASASAASSPSPHMRTRSQRRSASSREVREPSADRLHPGTTDGRNQGIV
jgi:glycosyltransferase involved in cell wall biosynthesis